VHVNDSVNRVLRARLDDSVEVTETFRFQHARIVIILEVSVVHRNADTVQAQRLEECSIVIRKEIFEKLLVLREFDCRGNSRSSRVYDALCQRRIPISFSR
jgi:hypothetical protein